MHKDTIQYRPEVDGLRAVAVVSVILYHGKLAGLDGGFLGVDVFFVLSGYLITSILLTEAAANQFSILKFYERRARRILPALMFMLLCTLPFAWIYMLPDDLMLYGQSLLSVATFLSNIFFWKNSGYFDPASEDQVLLHTWSLAVEEQYYIFFPLMLLLLLRLTLRWQKVAWFVMAAMSLALAQWATDRYPNPNFYLLPTRAWELFAGCLVAYELKAGANKVFSIRISGALAALGLLMVAWALVWLDSSHPMPGLYSLLPVGGTCLILLFASARNWTGRLLSNPVFVGVGLISYSAYLWHQPIFSFARMASVDGISVWMYGLLTFLTLAIAKFSHAWVESPFRNKALFGQTHIFVMSVGSLLMVGLCGAALVKGEGFRSRIHPDVLKRMESYRTSSVAMKHDSCFVYTETDSAPDFGRQCYPADESRKTVYLIGDSNAAALRSGMLKWLPADTGFSQLTISGCLPVIGGAKDGPSRCRRLSDKRFDAVLSNPDSTVVLHAMWPSPVLAVPNNGLAIQLTSTLDILKKRLGTHRIVVVGCVPTWAPSLTAYLAKQRYFDSPELLEMVKNPNLVQTDVCNEKIAVIAKNAGVKFFDPSSTLCKKGQCLSSLKNDAGVIELTSFDNVHLTAPASELVVKRMLQEIGVLR